jgi:putative FmdB family regulatory protein
MPLYEYECDACGQRFEVIQKFSEVLDACAECGKGPVRRLASSPAIQFKGSGFYITDYAKKDTSESAGRKDDTADKTEKKQDTTAAKPETAAKAEKADKSDSKTAKKADTPSASSSSSTPKT